MQVHRGLEIEGVPADEETVARFAAEVGSPGVEAREEDGAVRWRVYLPADAGSSAMGRARALWRTLGHAPLEAVPFEEPQRDWGAEGRRSFRGTRVGPFWIGPPWARPAPGRIALRINPGRAFGTGLHPTTRIALRLLAGELGERPRPERARVLDVGAGSGVLALAALALGARAAVGLDVDPYALANAAENRALNRARRLSLLVGSPSSLTSSSAFDLILANLECAALTTLLPDLARLLSPRASLVVSGLTREQRAGFLEAAAARALAPLREMRQAGWWGALLRRAAQDAPRGAAVARFRR